MNVPYATVVSGAAGHSGAPPQSQPITPRSQNPYVVWTPEPPPPPSTLMRHASAPQSASYGNKLNHSYGPPRARTPKYAQGVHHSSGTDDEKQSPPNSKQRSPPRAGLRIAPMHVNVRSVISPDGAIYHPCHGYSAREIGIFDLFPGIVKLQNKKFNEVNRADYLANLSDMTFVGSDNQPVKVDEAEMWFMALKYLFDDIASTTPASHFDAMPAEMRYVIKQYMSSSKTRQTFFTSIKKYGFLRVMSDVSKKIPQQFIRKLIQLESEKKQQSVQIDALQKKLVQVKASKATQLGLQQSYQTATNQILQTSGDELLALRHQLSSLRTSHVQLKMEHQQLKHIRHQQDEQLNAKQNEFNALRFKCEALERQLRERKDAVAAAAAAEVELKDEDKREAWDFRHVHRWMMGLDGGHFKKYDDLYQHLRAHNIDGVCLEKLNEAVLVRLGIANRRDQQRLLQHIQSLLRM